MRSVKFDGANLRLGPPADWDAARHGECLTIWGLRDRKAQTVTTIWQPTPEEREAIAAGANVALVQVGSTIAPTSVVAAAIPAIDE